MNHIPSNTIRQILFLFLIVLLGVVLFYQLQNFIPALLGAYTLYVIMRKWMYNLEVKRKWKAGWAAALLMFVSFIVILFPIFLLINMMTAKIAFAVQHSSEVLTSIEKYINQYEMKYGIEIMTENNIKSLAGWSATTLPKVLGATFSSLTTIVVMYFILFFMLTSMRSMESIFYEIVPLKDENIILLRTELNSLVYSNALGIPLIALLQGVVGLIGYLVFGIREPMFWFVVTCITAMLPIVGAALAYVPLGLLLFAEGEPTKGLLLLAYGFGIIGTVDNFFRFWLQRKLGDVHPLITVFGVIVGLNLFGFIGLIFGPILISLFILLIRIYSNEFRMKTST